MASKKTLKVPDDEMFKTFEGPAGVVRSCKCCKHFELVRKGRRGVGRSYGFVEGNKARGRLIQHFKAAHPTQYEQFRQEVAQRLAAQQDE